MELFIRAQWGKWNKDLNKGVRARVYCSVYVGILLVDIYMFNIVYHSLYSTLMFKY